MEFFLDPSTWAGLLTLVILEVVLGIDNLIFVAILSEKLPPNQRDKARLIGLGLALVMRLALLSLISWVVTLTSPIIHNSFFSLSVRDVILLFGGLFLLFKTTIELHERLENNYHENSENKNYAGFWAVVIQIVILDAVFSLDAIITAVGMVNQLLIMMIAVILATTLMLLASKALTNFINLHQTVVVLCLSFLLMIGFSLVTEALRFYIPKGYLYAAIGFSILIEIFNQIARHNFMKNQSRRPMRQRAAEAIFRLMVGEKNKKKQIKKTDLDQKKTTSIQSESEIETFKDEERYMINGVLTLAGRSIRSIMTPRRNISWVNTEKNTDEIRMQLLDTPHSLFPVCKGELDEIIGIVRAKELLVAIEKKIDVSDFASKILPIVIPDTLDPINLLGVLRRAQGSFVIVSNEFGVIQGLITPLDVLEAIAGEFPDADETPDIIKEHNSWLVKGETDLHSLQQLLNTEELIKENNYASLGGLLIAQKGQLPLPGEVIYIYPFHFHIIKATEYRIDLVRIIKNQDHNQEIFK
ncbi:TerC family protein [Buchnera aphidicola]|uniref:Yoae n=1 Tax=Buchnera aphidicola str. USDA (Myzus persicae) TaxID=1009856 RepID=W0NZW9_BUCMP|nr:TerC family protein [Buchnera aphidicola]AHG60061.1 Yoae [Buchnera aphidicola str. USDA (Myzus persicae)]AHG60641.1 Yoae [Buchnera aphidicola str. W106 (Myzus persicae)]AHG61213.1 Yoae [Buchnera aphidicola str. G002 (Myzus persicae)]AHG61786.1 Yoae [Buchnera aphidicola str. F009 (Myzus persicae)]WAI03254.1 MAG: TerC family protein [Buchnera aphidicola (Myzus persicae)]